MIKYAKSKKLSVSFSSNGLLLNKEKCNKLLESNLDHLVISFDGTDFQTYNLHRQPSTEMQFNNLLDNIRYLVAMKKKSQKKMIIELQYIVTKYNFNLKENFGDFAKLLGVDSAYFMTLSVDAYVPNKEFISNVLAMLPPDNDYNRYIIDGDKLRLKGGNNKFCHQEVRQPMISVDGLLLPCCNDIHLMKYIFGDLREKDFLSIWDNENTVKQRNFLYRRGDQMCKYCFPDNEDIIIRVF